MKRLQSFLTLLVLLLVSVSASFAATYKVGDGQTYSTIQAAVTLASGGDIIEVYDKALLYTENVNIPGGKNGLIIKAATGHTPTLDGSTVGNPKVAFRIASDNVTINGFTIQNYNYSGLTNVAYGQAQRGIGIEAINASSQHTFTDNNIKNCNWGIYVREGNNITVQGNDIEDFFSTTFVGTWENQGGVGIAFISGGIAMDGNIINNNDLLNTGSNGTYGIVYGRIGASVGADFVQITNNDVEDGTNTNFYAYGIYNIKSGESVDFSNNGSENCWAALDLVSTLINDNDDVTITDNDFIGTISTREVRASGQYSGEKLWELMTTNGNDFSNGTTDKSNAIASLDNALPTAVDTITTYNSYKYILNNLDAAITEAEGYLSGAATRGRVYVTNGTYTAAATATVNGIGTEVLKIHGQSTAAILTNTFAGTLLDIQAGAVEVDPLTFQIDLTFGNVIAINTTGASNEIHHVAFTSVNNGANYYTGIQVNDAANNVDINNNTFTGAIGYGIRIESDNTASAVIECNSFDNTAVVPNNRGIMVEDITVGGDIENIEIISNTFAGNFAYSIQVVLPTATSDDIEIGKNNKGNIFSSLNIAAVAVNISQNTNPNQVSVNYNKFDATFTDFIENNGALALNAGFNYFNVGLPYATTVPSMIAGTGAASVSWLPIYTSPVDQDLTDCGFQPDLTSLWTPVYTAIAANNAITVGTNEFFLTIAAALNATNTVSGTNQFVYLYMDQDSLGGFTYNETLALTFQTDDITLSSAPAQPAKPTEPNPLVLSTFAGPIVNVNNDDITINNIEFDHNAANTYQIYVSNATQDGLTVTNCDFDASSINAITFVSGAGTNIIINNNIFALGGINYGIDFGTTANYTNVEIDGNTFNSSVNTSYSIRIGQVNTFDLTDNNFEAGVTFTAGTANTTLVNIYGNTFLPTASSVPVAINFYHDGVVAGIYDDVNIEQNKIHQFGIGVNVNVGAGAFSARVGNFLNWTINENYFANMNDGIDLNGVTGATLDATNNHWQSNYGPHAYANAPAWHDNTGTSIIANSYGYLYNYNAGMNVVPLQDATYINFTPWWNGITGAPSTYTGTTFAPIENNEGTPEYFASLIFAIDETATTFDIYMQDVPNWTGSSFVGANVYYVESNTIENASKNLDIWGQPFFPPTTKIATVGNDPSDAMFLIENGTFNINFLELTYDVSGAEDIASGVVYDNSGLGTIDWCYINGLRTTAGLAFGVLLTDNTTISTITNSLFEDLDGSSQVFGAAAYNGASLTVDNTEFKGRNNLGSATFYESGILIFGESNLTLTNSYFTDYDGNGGFGAGLLANNGGINPVGNINIYQNIFENNQIGLQFGENAGLNEDYSLISVYNNIIRSNTLAGLVYDPGVASILNVENNSWGNNNGPRSEAQVGGTQENTFNETNQGNAVSDGNANATIDYIPWRRIVTGDDLATKIAGPRFAPIVRTNAANLAQGLYANFNDAEFDLVPTQKVYAYAGDYSEHILIDVDNVQFIGKLAPATYSVGWILAPNSPIFVNAWANGTQGANAAAPRIISGGAAQPLLADDIAAFDDVSFKGFIFNTQATATPYVGNPTDAINFNLNTNDITFSYNTFIADASDKGILFGNGQHDNWDITYNKYIATGSGNFVYLDAQTSTLNINISYNDLDGGAITIDKQGAATITNFDITYNEFKNTSGAINLDGTAGGALQVITNFNVNNNVFESTNTYAFLVNQTADDAIVAGSDWTSEVEVTNNLIEIATSAQIVVGFANASPLTNYSNEITATCNWWNNVSGPTFALNPGGTGARASEGVFFTPWLSGSGNSATFGFTPTDACNVGERVWVNTTGLVSTKTIIFPSLQWAVQHASVVAGTNEHIFVDSLYADNVVENISLNLGATDYYLYNEAYLPKPVVINGTFTLAGINAYDFNLGDSLRVKSTLTLDNIGVQGQFILGDKNLIAEANITDASYGAVITNGTGYLVKENITTGGINRFPVAYTETGTYTPAEFTANAADYADGILKVRVKNYTPFPTLGSSIVDYKGIGEINHSVQNIWTLDFNKGTATADPNMSMTLKFADDNLNDANFTLNKTISYAAYWDMAPMANQWTTKKSTSSWNGSDGVQVTSLNLETGVTDWALFYGSTSYALSTPPTQAKNIQWIGGDDRNLQFQWQRNGANNQYYAIMAVKGSMTAVPSPAFVPQATGATVNSPWVASVTSRNFSDGYVDKVTSASWTAGLFHNLAATPTDVKVLKVGQYGAGSTENVTITDLDQGTYYTFFVANFNYGNGLSTIANMVTGADGVANYELGTGGPLNPRTRKTQPAVYMTLDVPAAASTASVVYGTTAVTPTFNYTDVTDLFTLSNHWRRNGTVTGLVPVNNQYNGDDLIGGYYAQFCEPVTTPLSVDLYFKGYGNNGGANWGIKYSENNSTYTFTTPSINSTTNRSRSVETKYYLVSAYDGDGKVAALYDNNQDLQIIFDAPSAATAALTPAIATCVGNVVNLSAAPSSIPNATFVGWEVSNDGGTTWTSTLVSGGFVAGNASNALTLAYADNGKVIRAKYLSNSVCSFDGTNFNRDLWSNTVTLQIYDNTITGSNPAVSGDDTPYLCSDVASVTFTSSDNNPAVLPKDMKLQGWYLSSDNGGTWSTLITAATTYGAATITSVTGVTTTTGTIVFNNANMNLLDGYQVRAEWKNGDCSVSQTAVSTLNIVSKPVVTALSTPAGVCVNQPISIASVSSAANTGATQSIQWMISNDNVTYNNLATSVNATVTGETSANVSITPLNLVLDGYYVKVVYTNTENGTSCVTESNAVQIDVLPSPVFNAIADQTVCENTNMVVTAVDANPTSWAGNIVWYHTSVAPANIMTTGGTYFGSTVTINGTSNATFTINNTNLNWDGQTVIAYNNNGACAGSESFEVNVDAAPTVGTATVTAGEVCAGGSVVYSTTYTPAATGTAVWYYNGNPVTTGTSVTSDAFNNATIVTSAGTTTLTLTNVSIAIDGDLVYAEIDNGTCAFVNSNSVAADIETIPVAPATVGAQNIFSHRFDITWTAVANADEYHIQVSSLADFSVIEATDTLSSPAVTWTGMAPCVLDPATTYYFRVRASNQCGDGSWLQSNIVTLDPTVSTIAYTLGDGLFGNISTNTSSTSDTYRITYYQLDAGLDVVVPAYYQIKPTGSMNWIPAVPSASSTVVDLTSYLTLYLGTPGAKLNLDVEVRFSPILCGTFSGNLVHSTKETCTGVTEMPTPNFVAVSGTGVTNAPTLDASNGIATEATPNEFVTNWTNGGGNQRLVIVTTDDTFDWTPTANTTYTTASNDISTATVLETGKSWLVGVTPTIPFTITGLTAGINYYVHIWEYNECNPGTEQYDANSYSFEPYYLHFDSDETTPIVPDQISGRSSRRLADTTLPLNVSVYLSQRDGNPTIALSAINVTIGKSQMGGTFSISPISVVIPMGNGASNSFNFTWTDACGVDDGWLTATATNIQGNITNTFDLNVSTPTQQARIMVPVGVPCTASATFKWTNGNGAGRLFVVRESLLPAAPADFQNYGINPNWTSRNSSNHIGDSTYVMGVLIDGDLPYDNQITITNLTYNSTFYFRAYEFNGCDIDLRKYNINNATFNPRSRTITCKEGNNLHDIVLDKFNAVSNSGKGVLNFNTLYEANISGFELRRMNTTDEEMNGMLVGSYMNNSELVAEGNTLTGKSYNFTDNSSLLEVGKTYLYQLVAIAFDGTRIEVAETELTINDDIYTGISEFSVSPVTVTNNEVRFDLTVNKAQNVTITMFDVTGQKVATIANDARVTRGTQQFTTNIQNVTNGTYMIVVEADGVSAVQKFQIVR